MIHCSVFTSVLQICTRGLKLLHTCFKDSFYDIIIKLHPSEFKVVDPRSWFPNIASKLTSIPVNLD